MDCLTILPADTYLVINKSIINDSDRKILTMLYQPIVGPLAIMLYFSLWSDLDKLEIMSLEYTHHHIITNMHISLDEVVKARKKLEAVGLLKTYVKKANINNYIYELYSPISAYEFLNHPVLNIVLYNNVGKREYDKIIDCFKIPRITLTDYCDITTSFTDIYASIPLTSYEMINDEVRKENKLSLNINTNFDFNFLISSMPDKIINEKAFTKDIRELILNLSFIYNLDVMKMQAIIKGCINEKGHIAKEEFRKACRNYYQFDNAGLLPSLVDRSQPEYLRNPIGDSSKRAKMIYTFEITTPYNFLRSKVGGAEPTKRDLKLIEDLVVDYGLKPGVVNVLIDYSLKTNDHKLTRNFVETIAGQWKRLNVETVDEAMSLAEKEHKKYKKNPVINKSFPSKTAEKVPEWFDSQITSQKVTGEEQAELEDLLKEFR